jgi:hypothetical protein
MLLSQRDFKPLLMNALEKVRAKLIDISSTYGHEGANGAISFDAMRNAPAAVPAGAQAL